MFPLGCDQELSTWLEMFDAVTMHEGNAEKLKRKFSNQAAKMKSNASSVLVDFVDSEMLCFDNAVLELQPSCAHLVKKTLHSNSSELHLVLGF